ncbi:hypothetical protein HHK36_022794 [Tetracentron sinense]|uniref:Uncharacterized protein n=1 Tax=Tetracentron sinense TaxID=13715 RepID=A0A834YVG4_TETSI|nr:hypothetical protein HHK36_022794 [Tetracentron sinense]
MGRSRTEKDPCRSQTLPPSPSHSFSSSSSSDFEFTISLSPLKSSSSTLSPADDLFYKGQLLPLHLSPRLSMVRTLLLASSSTSSSSDTTTTTTTSRDSSDSHSSFSTDLLLLTECDSSRPSSATQEEDEFKQTKKPKYFSLARFSSVKQVVRKYLKKVRPLYEKFAHKQTLVLCLSTKVERSVKDREISGSNNNGGFCYSFSGNLRYPQRISCVASCPSSMRSSPSHSGVLYRNGHVIAGTAVGGMYYADKSSMEELQSAIQGAIAHCKNSMIQKETLVSKEI